MKSSISGGCNNNKKNKKIYFIHTSGKLNFCLKKLKINELKKGTLFFFNAQKNQISVVLLMVLLLVYSISVTVRLSIQIMQCITSML